MKKFVIFAVAAVLFGICNCAQSTEFETIENSFTFKMTHTIPVSYAQKIKDSVLDGDHSVVITDFLKSCEPYNENINIDFFGFNFSLNAKSNGWVNEKCSYEFYAKINSISSYTKQVLKITADDSEISAINPKFTCDFNKKQLDIFVNEIMSSTGKGSRAKEAIYKPAQNDIMTSRKHSQLVSMLRDENVCRIVNEEEIMKAIQVFSSSDFMN